MLLIGTGFSVTSPYLPLYCTESLGMTAAAFGLFMAVTRISGVVANSLIAKRSDRGLNRKGLIVAAAFSSALGFASYLAFRQYGALLVTVSILNGFGAAVIPQMYAYTHEAIQASNTEDRTFAMSALRSLFSLGFMLGPLAGTLVLGLAGYPGLFLSTSFMYVLVALSVLLFLPNPNQVSRRTQAPQHRGAAPSIRSWHILWPVIACTLLFTVNFVNAINTPLLIVHVLHGTHTDVGLVVSVCAGLEIPFMLWLGALGRKVSNHVFIMASGLLAMMYFAVLAIATRPWEVLVAQLLQAAFVAMLMGNGISYFTGLLPESPGVATSLYSNSSTIGGLLGNLGGGILGQMMGFRHANWVCFAVALVAFAILWRCQPGKSQEDSGARNAGGVSPLARPGR